MSDRTPLATTPAQGVRDLPCTMCWAPSGTPCQREPSGDHLRRWLDAYEGGLVTKADMAAVFARVVVITKWRIVPDVTS